MTKIENDCHTFMHLLREYARRRDFTINDIAKKLDIEWTQVKPYFEGTVPEPNTVRDLYELLQIDPLKAAKAAVDSNQRQLPSANSLGYILRVTRMIMGFNQKELGEILGVAPSSLCTWEVGSKLPGTSSQVTLRISMGITQDTLEDLLKSKSKRVDKHVKRLCDWICDWEGLERIGFKI